MDYLLLIVGLGILLLAANYLVDSSVAIAQRAKISNFIIGLTIVGIGTSSPELFVSVSSALKTAVTSLWVTSWVPILPMFFLSWV